jgi:hypothetical protein
MSDRKLRWLGLGLVTTAGTGVLGLTLAAGFEVTVLESAATQIQDAFSGLF